MSVCPGCGRADMAGITHVCPPPPTVHRCTPPLNVGLTIPTTQPDWECGVCHRVWRDWITGVIRQWVEVRGPSNG